MPAENVEFELGYLNTTSNGAIEFNLSATAPLVTLSGSVNVDLETLHVAIGSEFDVTIPEVTLNGDASVYAKLTNNSVELGFDVDQSYLDIEIETLNFGNWDINGTLEGNASMQLNKWQPGVSGEVQVTIAEQISNNLQITCNDTLTVDFGTRDLTPGTVTFYWQREQEGSSPELIDGHFNILNSGVNGNFTLCKITNNDPENPIEIELGDIALESGNLFTSWLKQYDQKIFYINSSVSIDISLAKVTWDDEKTISLGNIELEPGEFKFTWDTTDQEIKINNGIAGFGPLCSYEDSERKLSVDLLNVQDDYSKTMTLKWYETSGSISGICLDTDGTQLVDWIEFESIKYDSSGDTGRRLILGGFRADNFELKKNVDGNLEVSGKLYIANNLTYSKLANNNWKDLYLEWDLDADGVGYIEMDSEFNLDFEISATLLGVDLTTTFDLTEYFKIAWDVDFDGQGYIFIDTNGDEIVQLNFEISKDSQQYQPKWGLIIAASALETDDYQLSWDFTSQNPEDWIIQPSGYISEFSLINNIWVAWNGNWYLIWKNSGPT